MEFAFTLPASRVERNGGGNSFWNCQAASAPPLLCPVIQSAGGHRVEVVEPVQQGGVAVDVQR
jgi:hypothetical protein